MQHPDKGYFRGVADYLLMADHQKLWGGGQVCSTVLIFLCQSDETVSPTIKINEDISYSEVEAIQINIKLARMSANDWVF